MSEVVTQLEVTKSGKIVAPETEVSATEAYNLYKNLFSSHAKRVDIYTAIEGSVAGNPPYDKQTMKEYGLEAAANFNTLDARAKLERIGLPFMNLLTDSEMIFKVVITHPNFSKLPDVTRWEKSIMSALTKTLRKWKGWTPFYVSLVWQLVKFGVSPAIFYDDKSFRPRLIELPKFYVPNQALVDLDELPYFCVTSTYTLSDIFKFYKDADKLKDTPWNVEALKEFIMKQGTNLLPTYQLNAAEDVYDYQKRLQSSDIGAGHLASSITLVNMYYRTTSGKISHFIFDASASQSEFLFVKEKAYGSIHELLVLFMDSYYETVIHSTRGGGSRILPLAMAVLQLDNSILDLSRYASTPLLKGASDSEKITFTQGQPVYVPQTTEIMTNQLGANLNPLSLVTQYLTNKMNTNLGDSGLDPATPDAGQASLTPEEYKNRYFREYAIKKQNIKHFYRHLDDLVKNIAIRLLTRCDSGHPDYEYKKYFLELLSTDGVPEEVTDLFKSSEIILNSLKHFDISAARVAGDGSQYGLLLSLQELVNNGVTATFDARQQSLFNELFLEATLGHEQAKRFIKRDGEVDNLSGGSSLASVENSVMEFGGTVTVAVDNDHEAHIVQHLTKAQDMLNRVNTQQMDFVTADKFFTAWVAHMQGDQELGLIGHMTFYANTIVGKPFVASQEKLFKQILGQASFIRANALQQTQAALRNAKKDEEETAKVMTDQERADYVAERDQERKDKVLMAKEDRTARAEEKRGRIMEKKADADIKIKEKKANADISRNAGTPFEGKTSGELASDVTRLVGKTPNIYDVE